MSKFLLNKIALPVAIIFMSIGSAGAALNCTNQPTCAELGYSTANVDNCESYVLCPFDKAYKACTKVSEKVDCSNFTHASCPSEAEACTACGTGTDVKYQIASCKEGYSPLKMENIQTGTSYITGCTINSCSGYNLSYCPTGGTCSTCMSGTTKKYKLDKCNSPYVAKDGGCYNCSDMKTKLTNSAKHTYYAECLSDSSCNGTSNCETTSKFYSWKSSCVCEYIGFSNCLESSVPSIPEVGGSTSSKVVCQTTKCRNAETLFKQVITDHNALCPSYKVTGTPTFACTTYIPDVDGFAPSAYMCMYTE